MQDHEIQKFVTLNTVEKLKQAARKLKREIGITHTEALELTAKQAKFDNWHQITEAAKLISPAEAAYQSGVIIAMDIKDAEDFHDETGEFVKDDHAKDLCRDDLYRAYVESPDEEDGVPLREKYSASELREEVEEDLENYVFFRYTKDVLPKTIEEVKELVSECSFWQPRFIWFKGSFQDNTNYVTSYCIRGF